MKRGASRVETKKCYECIDRHKRLMFPLEIARVLFDARSEGYKKIRIVVTAHCFSYSQIFPTIVITAYGFSKENMGFE